MKISEPGLTTIDEALNGNLSAIESLIMTIQPGIYKLAVHVLGDRDDAADATQEVLLKTITHLAGFRGESAFSTWVWRIAYNHLMTACTRKAESPEVSLEQISQHLNQGLEFASKLAQERGEPVLLSPYDKLEARQLALVCTQSMLMALDRESRLVYVIHTVFGLESKEAAAIAGITPEAYRKRLSRSRARLNAFMAQSCGLCSPNANCRCEKQLPAVRYVAKSDHKVGNKFAISKQEVQEADRQFSAFNRVVDAAVIIRAHPAYKAPGEMRSAILEVLTNEGFIGRANSNF